MKILERIIYKIRYQLANYEIRKYMKEFDLVISNYAFSELTRQIQDRYLYEVILKSKSGYITYNELSNKMLDGYNINEILRLIPGSQIIAEKPLTYKNNCILIWGNK